MMCSREYLVDVSTCPFDGERFLLAMESEAATIHGVGDAIDPDNGYAWDYSKLLFIEAPLRIFVARVGSTPAGTGDNRRRDLLASLNRLTGRALTEMKDTRKPSEVLRVVYILGNGRRSRKDSVVAVWDGHEFITARAFA